MTRNIKVYVLLVWMNEQMMMRRFSSKEEALKCKKDLESRGVTVQWDEYEIEGK